MNWLGAVSFIALMALGGEELAHYRNPGSGPGLVQTALAALTGHSGAAVSQAQNAPDAAPAAAAAEPRKIPLSAPRPDLDQLAKNMSDISDAGLDDGQKMILDQNAARRVKCVENTAWSKMGLPPVPANETEAETRARQRKLSVSQKLEMTKIMMDETPAWGCNF